MSEHTVAVDLTGLRSLEEIEAFRRWLPTGWYAGPASTSGPEYLAGVLAVLDWVLAAANNPPGPISQAIRALPFNDSTVSAEQSAAYRQLTGEDKHPEGKRWGQNLVGAEHALGWLLGGAEFAMPEDWPWPNNG